MKYYSDLTKKIYETEKDLLEAEKAYNDKLELQNKKDLERKKDFEKVKEAYKQVEAQKQAADELLRKFLEKYQGIHKTMDIRQFLNSQEYLDCQKDLVMMALSALPFIF